MFSTPCVEHGIKPYTPLDHIMAKKRLDHHGHGGSGRKAAHAKAKAERRHGKKKRHTTELPKHKPGTHLANGTVEGKSRIAKGG